MICISKFKNFVRSDHKNERYIDIDWEKYMELKNNAVNDALKQAKLISRSRRWSWGFPENENIVLLVDENYPSILHGYRIHFDRDDFQMVTVSRIEEIGGNNTIYEIQKKEPSIQESTQMFLSVLNNEPQFISELNNNIENYGNFDVYGQALNKNQPLTKNQCHALENAFEYRGYIVSLVDYEAGIFTLEFPDYGDDLQ